MEEIFNKLGAQGWELVAINMERATFKREVKTTTTAELQAFEEMPPVPYDVEV